jgi:hypothetical protein
MVYFNLSLILLIDYLIIIECHDDYEYYKLTQGTSYIYYKTLNGKENSVTGTGNRLKDVLYLSKCSLIECNTCCEGSINNITCLTYKECYNIQKLKIPYNILFYMNIFIFVYITLPIGWAVSKIMEYKQIRGHAIIKKIFFIYSAILLPPYGIVIFLECLFKKRQLESADSSQNGTDKKYVKLFYKKKFQVSDFQNGIAKNIELEEKNFDSESSPIEDEIVLESIYAK